MAPKYVAEIQQMYVMQWITVFVGPCHHGMTRPQVADGGTASDMQRLLAVSVSENIYSFTYH